MEPRPETLKAAAETNQRMQSLVERCEAMLQTIPVERQKAIAAGDLEKAKKLDAAKLEVNETLGLLRAHPITSALGGSELLGTNQRGLRGEDGKYAGYGSDRYFVGVHTRMNK